MPKYIVTIPHGKGPIEASNRKDAIDTALALYRAEIDRMIADGSIYKVPSLCREYVPRNGMVELPVDQPIKPSRKLDGKPKDWRLESDYSINYEVLKK